jgi:lipoprotein LprG
VDFVLFNRTFYIKGPTGGYSRIPASLATNLFDPAAILDPNRGIAKIVTSVRNAHTEGTETVNGTDCYKIGGTVDKNLVSTLVPGVGADVGTTLWVATGNGNQPVKAEFAVPGTDGSQGATVDVTISNVNVPVTVNAPA